MVSLRGCGGLLQPAQRESNSLHLVLREAVFAELFNEARQAAGQYVVRHLRLELALSDKEDHRMQQAMVEMQVLGEAPCVSVVLLQRVLEMILVSIQYLSPLVLVRCAKYPTIDVLRFDHENTEDRNDDVVDLGCAISGRDYYVVDPSIDRFIQGKPHPKCSDLLPEPASDGIEHMGLTAELSRS